MFQDAECEKKFYYSDETVARDHRPLTVPCKLDRDNSHFCQQCNGPDTLRPCRPRPRWYYKCYSCFLCIQCLGKMIILCREDRRMCKKRRKALVLSGSSYLRGMQAPPRHCSSSANSTTRACAIHGDHTVWYSSCGKGRQYSGALTRFVRVFAVATTIETPNPDCENIW